MAGLLLACSFVSAEPQSVAWLAFEKENRLRMVVGSFDARRNVWTEADRITTYPEPGDLFTLFTPAGVAGRVRVEAPSRVNASDIPVEWSVNTSSWSQTPSPYALAIRGDWPAPPRTARALPLDDAVSKNDASLFLKRRGLTVDSPRLTEAWAVDLDHDGAEERLIAAHNDMAEVVTGSAAVVYALLIVSGNARKAVPLAEQVSLKPSGRTLEEHEALYRERDFYRVLGAADIDGDGSLEVAVYRLLIDAAQIDLYSFPGGRPRLRLSSFKQHYL